MKTSRLCGRTASPPPTINMEVLQVGTHDVSRWTIPSEISRPTRKRLLSYPSQSLQCLDAALLGDFPAKYFTPRLGKHEFPAVGIYVDDRIIPGFRYKVRTLTDPKCVELKSTKLFKGNALRLENIGRGYSRRLTFESSEGQLNENNNYFWADSCSTGYALEIEVVSPLDQYSILDHTGEIYGELTVLNIMEPQEEISQEIMSDRIKKFVRVQMHCRFNWLNGDLGSHNIKISGVAECIKRKGRGHGMVERIHCLDFADAINSKFILVKSEDKLRTHHVVDEALSISYAIRGLGPTEFPVIGTYVSPKILPGFKYRVRFLPDGGWLFKGRALKLLSVGIGYGKRISFQPDEGSLNDPYNYFWSDSSPDGFAFQPVAIENEETLRIRVRNPSIEDSKN